MPQAPSCAPSATMIPKQQEDTGVSALQGGRSKGVPVPWTQPAWEGSEEPKCPTSAGSEVPGLLWHQTCYFLFVHSKK